MSGAGRLIGLAVLASAVTAGCGGTAADRGGALDPRAVPLGDGHVGTSPKVGYVDSCITQFGGIGGARTAGPWINARAKTWNYTTKLAVNGAVRWPVASYSARAVGGERVLEFNDLPVDHGTGVFPIAASDPAFRYDQNGNRIAAHTFRWRLPLEPKPANGPACSGGGPIGVLIDGVALYNALDGEGRDAGAHEVLDRCAGHPDPSNTYHHHDIPPCILSKAPNGRATLAGYALDGYGIYVVKSRAGALPTNSALDACHGKTSTVPWNGRLTRIYHYVATLEYPYTVGCFHGTPISIGRLGPAGGPPGGPGGGPPGGPGGPPAGQ